MTKLLGWLRYCKFMTCNVETKFASACQGQRPNAKGLEILNIELQYTVIVNTCGKHCASSKLAFFHSVLHKLRCNTHIIKSVCTTGTPSCLSKHALFQGGRNGFRQATPGPKISSLNANIPLSAKSTLLAQLLIKITVNNCYSFHVYSIHRTI